MNILIEHIISASDLVQVHDMETVFASGAHFYAIEIDRVVGIQVKIHALQKEARVNTIRGGDDPAGTRIIPCIKSKEARGTSYDLYGTCVTIYSICVGRGEELKCEGGRASCRHSDLFCCWAIAHGICIAYSRKCIQSPLHLCTELCGVILAGYESNNKIGGILFKTEHIPADIYVIEVCGNTSIDEFYGDHIFQRAAESPAELITEIIGSEIAVTAIDCNGDGALLTVFAGRVRE